VLLLLCCCRQHFGGGSTKAKGASNADRRRVPEIDFIAVQPGLVGGVFAKRL